MGKYADLLTTTDEEKAVAQLRQLRCRDGKGIGNKKDDAVKKKPGYRDTGRRLSLREIRILRPDGKQTAILTSIKAVCLTTV